MNKRIIICTLCLTLVCQGTSPLEAHPDHDHPAQHGIPDISVKYAQVASSTVPAGYDYAALHGEPCEPLTLTDPGTGKVITVNLW